MAGGTAIAQTAYSSLDANKPINEHKSNTAIMATSIGSGLAMGAATELFFNKGSKLIDKNEDWLKKNYIFAKPEDRAKKVDNWKETFRTTAFGTNEEVASNTFRSIDDWTKKLNNDNSLFAEGKGKKVGDMINKGLRSGIAANTVMAGMSTTKGRIFNYGIGTAMSAIAGGVAVHHNNKSKEQRNIY